MLSAAPTIPQRNPLAEPMALLRSGVPLSLLLDLAVGPRSEDLLRRERPAGLPGPRPA